MFATWNAGYAALRRAEPVARAAAAAAHRSLYTRAFFEAATPLLPPAFHAYEWLGMGADRIVFGTPWGALKLAREWGENANLREGLRWAEATPAQRRCLVPVLAGDYRGRWLLMEAADTHKRVALSADCWAVANEMGIFDRGDKNRDVRGRLLDYANPAEPVAREVLELVRDVHAGKLAPEDALLTADILETISTPGDAAAFGILRDLCRRLSKVGPVLAKLETAKRGAMFRTPRGFVVIHRSTRGDAPPGSWQVTRFDAAMTPLGHFNEPSLERAAREVMREHPSAELVRWNPR